MPVSIGSGLLIGGNLGGAAALLGIAIGSTQVWAKDPNTVIYTASGTITRPTWAYYGDWVILPAGGGGGAGEGAFGNYGIGGNAGSWVSGTLTVPDGTLSCTIGAGGTGGQTEKAAGSQGGTTILTGPSGTIGSAVGGTGGPGANNGGSGQAGKTISPNPYSAFGDSYSAGTGGTGSGGTGGIGAGGSGGNGGAFGSWAKGGTGGRGQIWIRWRSY